MPRHKANPLKPAADALSELAQTMDALEDFDADDLAARVEKSLQKPLQEHRERKAREVQASIEHVRARLKEWAAKEAAPLFLLLGEEMPEDPIAVFELLRKKDAERYDRPEVMELIETVRKQTEAVKAVTEYGRTIFRPRRSDGQPEKRPGDFDRGMTQRGGAVESFILREAAKQGGIKSGDVVKKFKMPRESVRLVFKRLIKEGILHMEGDRSTARYFLKSRRRK